MPALIFPFKMYHEHLKRQIGKNVDSSKYPESFAIKLLNGTQVHRNSDFMSTGASNSEYGGLPHQVASVKQTRETISSCD